LSEIRGKAGAQTRREKGKGFYVAWGKQAPRNRKKEGSFLNSHFEQKLKGRSG